MRACDRRVAQVNSTPSGRTIEVTAAFDAEADQAAIALSVVAPWYTEQENLPEDGFDIHPPVFTSDWASTATFPLRTK